MKQYLQTYDIIFLSETHAMKETNLQLPGYKEYSNPCVQCDQKYPRGGSVFFLKRCLTKYVSYHEESHNDAIVLNLVNNNIICGIYIPPSDSNYFSDHFQYLESLIQSSQISDKNLLIIGDLNCRLGALGTLNKYEYTWNPDTTINSHGHKMNEICKEHNLQPINHLITCNKVFDGGFTFYRGEQKTQIDWGIANATSLQNVLNLEIDTKCPNISDHKSMILEYSFDFSLPINCTYESILDICRQPNNHSKRKNIRKENIDENLFITLCGTYITEEMTNNLHSNSKLTSVLNDVLYKAAKDSCKMYKKQDYQSQTNGEDYQSMKNELQEEDRYRWRSVIDCKDSKKLWNHINWRGDLHRDTVKLENHHNDYANVLKERSSCPNEQYSDRYLQSCVGWHNNG